MDGFLSMSATSKFLKFIGKPDTAASAIQLGGVVLMVVAIALLASPASALFSLGLFVFVYGIASETKG